MLQKLACKYVYTRLLPIIIMCANTCPVTSILDVQLLGNNNN